MNGPRVMCNGCAEVEVDLGRILCDGCSAAALDWLSSEPPPAPARNPELLQIGPTDI